jgi:hypothetical protein
MRWFASWEKRFDFVLSGECVQREYRSTFEAQRMHAGKRIKVFECTQTGFNNKNVKFQLTSTWFSFPNHPMYKLFY